MLPHRGLSVQDGFHVHSGVRVCVSVVCVCVQKKTQSDLIVIYSLSVPVHTDHTLANSLLLYQ